MKAVCEWRNKECKDHVIFKLYFPVLAFILFFKFSEYFYVFVFVGAYLYSLSVTRLKIAQFYI